MKPRRTLKDWRSKRKLSQSQAAKLFGITQGHWSHLECGRRRARVKLAKSISVQTGVPFEALAL